MGRGLCCTLQFQWSGSTHLPDCQCEALLADLTWLTFPFLYPIACNVFILPLFNSLSFCPSFLLFWLPCMMNPCIVFLAWLSWRKGWGVGTDYWRPGWSWQCRGGSFSDCTSNYYWRCWRKQNGIHIYHLIQWLFVHLVIFFVHEVDRGFFRCCG